MSPDVDLDDVADDLDAGISWGEAWLESQWYYQYLAGGAELALALVGAWTFVAFGFGVVGGVGIASAVVAIYSLLRRVLWVIGR